MGAGCLGISTPNLRIESASSAREETLEAETPFISGGQAAEEGRMEEVVEETFEEVGVELEVEPAPFTKDDGVFVVVEEDGGATGVNGL